MNYGEIKFKSEIRFLEVKNGKPVFEAYYKSVLNLKSGFEAKLLCDGLTATCGTACAFGCTYCSVDVTMRHDRNVAEVKEKTGLTYPEFELRRIDAVEGVRRALLRKGSPRFADPNDQRVIELSPIVDCCAGMSHVRGTIKMCLVILELTHWHIRLLSKSTLLALVAAAIPEKWKSRIIFGFSTGILDPVLSAAIEIGTSPVLKRLETLGRLQAEGYRTFGMVCPILPHRDYGEFARHVSESIDIAKCEHVWAEPLNARGQTMVATAEAAAKAGFVWEAQQIQAIRKKVAHEEYSRMLFLALTKVIPAEKLRFLQNVNVNTYNWWLEQKNYGAVPLLSKSAKAHQLESLSR